MRLQEHHLLAALHFAGDLLWWFAILSAITGLLILLWVLFVGLEQFVDRLLADDTPLSRSCDRAGKQERCAVSDLGYSRAARRVPPRSPARRGTHA